MRGAVNMSTPVKNSTQPKAHQPQCNVQVVRGKVTTKCLWNACKALSVGLLLLGIGTTMAVIGYYADQLSIRSETRGNSTVKIKNESRGFHLNNLSYAGPIVMGIGGFIVVAACVMTFEARDNAAKVVPARFKPNLNSSAQEGSTKSTPRNSRTFQRGESKRTTSVQTPGGSRCPGLPRPGSSEEWSPKNDPAGKRAFTAAFVWFSRELMENSAMEGGHRGRRRVSEVALNRSPSAPDLAGRDSGSRGVAREAATSAGRKLPPKDAGKTQREALRPQEAISSNLLLRPSHLQRQALSVDNPFYDYYECFTPPAMRLSRQQSGRSGGSKDSVEMELGSSAGVSGSQASMALDLHDCQVTLKVKDESANKRSDTARRHQLLRQKQVEDDRDDRFPRCSCIPRFLCAAAAEKCAVRTKSSVNLKSPCHHCLKASGSCCGRGHAPRMTADFRSQSFSQACTHGDPKRCGHHEDRGKIFCVEDHRKKANASSENVRSCCEEQLRCPRRRSPGASPHRSPRSPLYECRARRTEGSECPVHPRARDAQGGCPFARNNARKRRSSQRIEGSLSAEEQNPRGGRRAGAAARSASFSPTRHRSTSTGSSRNNSCREGSSPAGGSPSPVADRRNPDPQQQKEGRNPDAEDPP